MNTGSEFERQARQRKAIALIDTAMSAYDGEGFSAEDLEAFTDAQRRMLADAAGVREPSEVTWALVVSSVKARLSQTDDEGRTANDVFAKLARGTADDPFVGL